MLAVGFIQRAIRCKEKSQKSEADNSSPKTTELAKLFGESHWLTFEPAWAPRVDMTKSFGSLVFTPVVKALQERHGSRRQYASLDKQSDTPARLGPDEREFLAERDTFYMASVGATGWPYVQHRGGPKGFLKVIDDRTIAFADFRGEQTVRKHR